MKTNDNGAAPSSTPAGGGSWRPSGSAATAVASRTAPAAPPPPGGLRAPSAPRERRPALAALGLLLVLVGALASVYLQQRAGDRVGVVEITQRVPQGSAIPASAVSEVMVAVDPNIHYVTWAQEPTLVQNYSAATDLEPGTLLVTSMLTTTSTALPAGDEILPLSLKDGDYPVGIQAGDTVSGYYVSNQNNDKTGQQYLSDGFTTPPIFSQVRVYDVEQANSSGGVDVELIVAQQYVNDAIQAASGGNLVLVFDKHVPSSGD